jgi:ferritin-like metal-binding protein YciE
MLPAPDLIEVTVISVLRRNPRPREPLFGDVGRSSCASGDHPVSMEAVMGLFSKDIETLDDLFVHTLQDIYYAENQITEALPKMVEKATDPELKAGFEKHLRETEGQIARLERVFEMHGQEPKQVTCPAIDGIIKEANEIAGDVADKAVLDAALIAAAQAVEHYEITRYGTLIAWAKQLGRSDCAAVLAETLAEEKTTDETLTRMAESRANAKAEAVTEPA